MSNRLTLVLDGTDQTSKMIFGSLRLVNRLGGFDSASVSFDDLDILPVAGESYLLQVTDNLTGAKIFQGWLMDSETELEGDHDSVRCNFTQDIAAQFANSSITLDYSSGALTEKAILQGLFITYLGWPASVIGSYVITGIATAVKFTASSIQRCLDDLAAINGRYWYWGCGTTLTGELHYFDDAGETAPFALSDSPNNVTTFGYGKFKRKTSRDSSLMRVWW
jgi:hypothetical protein